MSNYSERINDLMFERKISPEELSAVIGVSVSTIYRWKNGETDLMLNNLVALADYFHCSTDFLMGRSEDMSDLTPRVCPPFPQRIREVMREAGITTYKLRNTTRFDGKYFQKWDRGAQPSSSTLADLADYFECSVDYLIGRE